ncbi:hypothetical protein, partial [Rhizobium leguminosarum]|uniref:hypothetical protein n=1 Tax=Rhizobium leguminosarum TaxID=384 RepID=UPI003F9A1911
AAIEGKLIYSRFPNTGTVGEQPAVYMSESEKREEKKVISGVGNFVISNDNKSILVVQGGNLGIIKPSPDQRIEKLLRTTSMERT